MKPGVRHYGEHTAARERDARIAEARRVLELSARHRLAFEYTAEGWRMVDATPEALAAALPMAAS